MRGRKPFPLSIGPHDRTILQEVARSETLPWYQVRRARTVLAIAAGQRTTAVASRLECDVGTVRRTCRRYDDTGVRGLLEGPSDRAARPGFPPRAAQIVELACLEPVAKGLHITHWSSEDLARQAVADGIVGSISPRTVRLILDRVDLQPHRTRYWRTTRLDARFKARAEKVLWCYANAERLARRATGSSAPMRSPTSRCSNGRSAGPSPVSIEQREFDYTRHGTVNLLAFLVVHTGRMRAVVLEKNDAANYIPALEEFRRRHRRLRGVYLIHDGGPSHIAGATAEYFDGCHGWWRPRLTPASLVARPGGVADPRLRRPLSEARLVAGPGGVHPAYRGLLARVQRTVCPPVRVDVDQPEDAPLVRETWRLNFGRDFVPGTLGHPAPATWPLFGPSVARCALRPTPGALITAPSKARPPCRGRRHAHKNLR